MGDEGLEHITKTNQKTALLEKGAAKSDAVDAQLQAVILAWPSLSDQQRGRILDIIE